MQDHHASAAAFSLKLPSAMNHLSAGGARVNHVEFSVYPNLESLTFTAFIVYREHHASQKAQRRAARRQLALSTGMMKQLDAVRYGPLVALD